MNPQSFSLLVLGEALIDLVQQDDGSYAPLLGGSPYNLCCAAAMQGVHAGYLNPFSTDAFGRTLQAQLIVSGAQVLSHPSPCPTSLSIVTIQNGEARYGFYREGVADRDYTINEVIRFLESQPAGVFHSGSLMAMPPDHHKLLSIIDRAKRLGWIISVDINARPRLASDFNIYRDALRDVAKRADWLKASDEDLHFMGFENVELANAESIANVFHGMGCSRIALTFGAKGAYLQVGDHAVTGTAPQINVVDTIGAGDVFWASCLAHWILDPVNSQSGQAVKNTLSHALRAAAVVCTRKGCVPPALNEL